MLLPIVHGQVICFILIIEKGSTIFFFLYYSWTERDSVLRYVRARKEASKIIIGITIGLRALSFEEHRVFRGWACG
jgi:hypothetical protein